MKKSYSKKKFNIITVLPILLCLCVSFLTTGFSAFQASLNINDASAIIKYEEIIRITNISVVSEDNAATSSYESHDITDISSSITLPNNNSSVTYDIEFTNLGNKEVGIINVTNLPSNLTYTFTDYNLGATICDDTDVSRCKLGAVSTIRVTFGYVENGYDSSNTSFNINPKFVLGAVEHVAKIGESYYDTLQGAVTSINNSNETTIVLLKNTTEFIEVKKGQNIVLELGGLALTALTTSPAIEITSGSVSMHNGQILTAASQGAINVHAGTSFSISGGKIIATGTKQAIYNNGGTTTISGTAYLSNTAGDRAAVHNFATGGTITITGGTIISEKYAGVLHEKGTLIIGTDDGTINKTDPVIRGFTYGVYNYDKNTKTCSNFEFYDGILKGSKNKAIYDDSASCLTYDSSRILYNSTEKISNVVYKTVHLTLVKTVTFDYQGGSVPEATRTVEVGNPVGTLPTTTKAGNEFVGWFDIDGNEITSAEIITDDITLYAHWAEVHVARINDTEYRTLAAAISAATNNVETTIYLTRNTSEAVTIGSSKKIILDLGQYTLSNPNNNAIITNQGTCRMVGGTISTSSTTTAAVNNTGNFTITGGSILATGQRQAIYNDGGTLTISGTAYLSATTAIRGTVQNVQAKGSITVNGGTIVSVNFHGIVNVAGALTIGSEGGGVSTTSPVIQGAGYGVYNGNPDDASAKTSFDFYDGILKGVTGAIYDDTYVANKETGYDITTGTEGTYTTAYLTSE